MKKAKSHSFINMPKETKHKLKIYCAKNEVSMTAVINMLVEKLLKDK